MSETRHTVDPKFTYRDKRTGTDVVLYKGLLDAAHRAGMVSMETEIQQYPSKDNDQTCIVRATVTFFADEDRRGIYAAIGDANPKNVGPMVAPHFIRMAETRAKARALRDALNVGMVTVEELGGDTAPEDDGLDNFDPRRPQDRPRPAPAPPAAPVAQTARAEKGDNWTTIWQEARAQGIKDRDALATFLGQNPAGMEPRDILAKLRDEDTKQPQRPLSFAG
jgi:hypothetical protein